MASVWVYDHDPARAKVDGLALEGDPLPIRRPRRIIVLGQALGGMGDLADMATTTRAMTIAAVNTKSMRLIRTQSLSIRTAPISPALLIDATTVASMRY